MVNNCSTWKSATLIGGKALLLMLTLALGGLAMMLSQAAAKNYRDLFDAFVKVSVLHFILATIYCKKVRHWTRWLVGIVAGAVLLCLIEFALRLFWHIRFFAAN